MGFPLYLAMNAAEIAASSQLPPMAWMSCHFSPCSQALTNLPLWLPKGALVMVDDSIPCRSLEAAPIAAQLSELIARFGCGGVILDFQKPGQEEIAAIIPSLLQAIPCPVAVSDLYAPRFQCPVFLRPGPLWEPLETHLEAWKGREIWLDACLCRQQVAITGSGPVPGPVLAWDGIRGGFFDEALRCHYRTEVGPDAVTFTFFDTPETMAGKLEAAHALGVSRAIGLWREVGTFLPGK